MAFREIVERYQARVYSVIRRILRDQNEVEDIAQEVFVSVFLSIREYHCRGSLVAWIYRIAVNQCYDYLRRRRVRPLVYDCDFKDREGRPRETRSQAPAIDAAIADRDLALKLLARLSDSERSLVWMREVEGYSIEELARITGAKETCVKVRLFRARRKMLKAAGIDRQLGGRSRAAGRK
jgi:RNA polymerase sigma-70 factor (ECF subfamily)